MSHSGSNQISDALRRALVRATTSDIEFSEEVLALHPDSTEEKVGCRPSAVCGVRLPSNARVAYVRARDESGPYWYVRVASDQTGPNEHIVTSENVARSMVLRELRRHFLADETDDDTA